ncbi:hypothetical protein ACS0TY_032212 [Phlomoides rotata]
MFRHHYQFDVFNEAIDTQVNEINRRFKDETVELLKLSVALDPKDNFRLFREDHIYDLADKFYPDDFTDQDMHYLRFQLQHYKSDIRVHESFQNLSTISELSQKLAETNKAQSYNLITRLIHLVLTLLVTITTTERAFSAMKHVKSVIRNKMEIDYLLDSMVVYIERKLFEDIDPDSIIDEFYRMKNRRAQLM